LKPIEKIADEPIDPPSPRDFDVVCLRCKQSISAKRVMEHADFCEGMRHEEEEYKVTPVASEKSTPN